MFKHGQRRLYVKQQKAIEKLNKTILPTAQKFAAIESLVATKADITSLETLGASVDLKADAAAVTAALALKADVTALDARPEWTSVPASAGAPGAVGQIAYESGFFYVCVSVDTWQRVALATW